MAEAEAARQDGAAGAFSLVPLVVAGASGIMATMAFVSLVGPLSHVLGLQPWQAGFILTASGVMWLLSARAWGSASDRIGRRPILLAGMAGFAVAYFAMCLFIDVALRTLPTVWLVVLGLTIGRGLSGAFYAAIPAASTALVADNLPPERRASAIASLGAANAIGMVIGPALAAVLAPYGLSLPLYGLGLLPLLALVFLWRSLPKVEHHRPTTAPPVRIGDPRLRRPIAVAFAAMLAVSTAQVVVGFFALDRLGLPPGAAARASGIALTTVGVALILSQLVVRRLTWTPDRLIRVGGTVAGLGFASTALATSDWALWASHFVAAAGMGWVFPAFGALAANSVGPDEQGSAAGTVSSAQGLGIVLGPMVGTLAYDIDPGASYVVAGGAILAAALWPAPRRLATAV
ncbi:MFS transporter [Zavarzinia sp. CC-PAN008]|uniref:MFS transporter n=1 Tax=Zavarzinia sp. CC-PAN008 TaxID=3243332 RepID=UPI003F743E68